MCEVVSGGGGVAIRVERGHDRARQGRVGTRERQGKKARNGRGDKIEQEEIMIQESKVGKDKGRAWQGVAGQGKEVI